MKVSVPKEFLPGETRVALIPEDCAKLVKIGLEIVVQCEAGRASGHDDDAYRKVGARVEPDVRQVYGEGDVIVKAGKPGHHESAGAHEAELLREGAALVGFLDPLTDFDLMRRLAERKITAVSMELVPRITRAQSMDALSSMANIGGYKAVLLAAAEAARMFPMMMTAAGTILPAHVLVIGAGVAGLQAIATARRLGAVVSGYDVRPAVKDQVESLGAKFVEMPLDTSGAEDQGGYAKEQNEEFLRRQRELMTQVVAQHDVVITTAAIPGKKAPVLITADMVRAMRPGSVIVDLAAERGGNCELTRCAERVVEHGVVILGPANLPATVPVHASQMYSRNIQTLMRHFAKSGEWKLDFSDEITAGCVVTSGGEVVHSRVRELMNLPPRVTLLDDASEPVSTGASGSNH